MIRELSVFTAIATIAMTACGQSAGDTPAGADGGAADGGAFPEYFVTEVTSFQPGTCAGFGAENMPRIVAGPPSGGGALVGSLDVISLGGGGSITLGFAPITIVDEPGPDFVVFENSFFISGDTAAPSAELGEVSVSEDGTDWKTFPCTKALSEPAPYGSCAGWRPVLSSPSNGVSPRDPSVSGGDAFDLAEIGLARARFVRIVDKSATACAATGPGRATSYGFDLDAIAVIHGER